MSHIRIEFIFFVLVLLSWVCPAHADPEFDEICVAFRRKADSKRFDEFNKFVKLRFDAPKTTAGIIFDSFTPKEPILVDTFIGWLGTPDYKGKFYNKESIVYYLGDANDRKFHVIAELQGNNITSIAIYPLKDKIQNIIAAELKYQKDLATKDKFKATSLDVLKKELFGIRLRTRVDQVQKEAKTINITCFNIPHPSEAGLGKIQLSGGLDNTSAPIQIKAGYIDGIIYDVCVTTRDGKFIEHALEILKAQGVKEIPTEDKQCQKYQLSPEATIEFFFRGTDAQGNIAMRDSDLYHRAESIYDKYRYPKAGNLKAGSTTKLVEKSHPTGYDNDRHPETEKLQTEPTSRLAEEYRKAAEKGNAKAQYRLGYAYERGLGVAVDKAEAVKWYRKSADQGMAEAQLCLGLCYQYGIGVAKDKVEAVKWLRKAAEQGHRATQAMLGDCYTAGTGVTRDYAEAAKWYRKAAEQGETISQFTLGSRYATGTGVVKDEAEAMKWYRQAADQRHVIAQIKVGDGYMIGAGVTKDEIEAVKWYRKAADQRNSDAMTKLGGCCMAGTGVIKDEVEAVKWYRKAADQGLPEAKYLLGCCYEKGTGIAQDKADAMKWFRQAAEQGLVEAQYRLGYCYEEGLGITKDETEAVKWYCKAADQGWQEAKNALRRLKK